MPNVPSSPFVSAKSLLLTFFCSIQFIAGAQKPQLRLPIGHKDEIYYLQFSKDGKYVLSAGSSSMRLWDFKTGKLLRSNDERGATDYLALNGDASKVFFIDGVTDPFPYVWDIEKGKVEQLDSLPDEVRRASLNAIVENLPKTIHVDNAVLSADGNKAALLNYDQEFEYWDIKSKKLLGKGKSQVPLVPDNPPFMTTAGNKDFVPHTSIGANGPMAVSRIEGHRLEIWDLTQNKVIQTLGDKVMKYKLACISPDGKSLLASDCKTIQHWDIESGRLIHTYASVALNFTGAVLQPETNGIYVGMESGIAYWNFESGGISTLWPGTTGLDKDHHPYRLETKSPAYLEVWQNGEAIRKNLPGFAGVALPENHTSYVNPELDKAVVNCSYCYPDTILLWDLKTNRKPSLLQKGFYYYLSPDLRYGFCPRGDDDKRQPGQEVWNLESGQKLYDFEASPGMNDEQYWLISPDGKCLLYSTVELFGYAGEYLLLNLETGEKINQFELNMGGFSPICAFVPGQKQLLVGSSSHTVPVQLIDVENGNKIRSFNGARSGIVALTTSADGGLVFAASGDYSLYIWDFKSGRLLASLVAMGKNDWAVTTPEGLFDASAAAMNDMYYTIGREVVELDQLKERYYEPGLLSKLLGISDGAVRDVSVMNSVALYPEVKTEIAGDQLQIKLTARNGGMGKLSFFINGKEVAEDLNPSRKTSLTIDLKAYDKYYLPGSNTLALRAYNSDGWLKSGASELSYLPASMGRGTGSDNSSHAAPMSTAKPHLYGIVVGTSDYAGAQLDLRYPDIDASAICQALQAAGSRLFEDRVHLKLLSTAAKAPADISSKTNIAAAFAEVAAKSKPGDIVLAYFAGHGLSYGSAEKSQFYYLTKDVASPDLKDPAVRDNYTVSSEDLTKWLTAITAKKQVMILDACNSGKMVESLASIGARELNSSQIRALDRMKDRTGMFILTGAAGDKVSYEASQYGQGLLTYSLLQGMSGMALTSDKRVDVMALFQFARDKVPELAKGIQQVQTPVLAFPVGAGSFDIGIVDASVKIPLAQVKPIFIRNVFQDEETFDDNLGLTASLAEYFQKATARGADAELIYVDVNDYENAYSIKGRYSINGDAVTVKGRLYLGKTSKGEFQLTGSKANVPELTESIVKKVLGLL